DKLENIMEQTILENDREKIKLFCNGKIKLNQLNYRTQIILIEEAYKILATTYNEKIKEKFSSEFKKFNKAKITKNGKEITTLYHALYYKEYKGVSYNIIQSDLESQANGLTRIYDAKKNKWKYVTDIIKEKELLKLASK